MALLVRRTEQRLLSLHAEGKLFGTVHTCIGQEFSAVAVGRALRPDDTVFSNHRGHRHFPATGGTVQELIAEVMDKSTGVCKGRGGSQHLQKGRYFSDGIQGGIVPVSAGLALAHMLSGSGAIVRSPLAAAKATFALNAAPNTRHFPAIILLLIGCLPPGKLRLIRAPENRGPPQGPAIRNVTRIGR
jgi:hypothetical protein